MYKNQSLILLKYRSAHFFNNAYSFSTCLELVPRKVHEMYRQNNIASLFLSNSFRRIPQPNPLQVRAQNGSSLCLGRNRLNCPDTPLSH